MGKIDLKDRKILYQLDIDSRQSFRSVGKKIGLSKDVVASRVKKLQEKGIITRFFTSFDYSRLGLIPLRFYFKYQYITPNKKKEIIDHFVNCEYSTVVASIEGSYDLHSLMLVKKMNDFYPFWRETLDKFGDYFVDRVFSVYAEDYIYKKSFLLDEKDERTRKTHLCRAEKVEFDDLDFKILKMIALDSRIPTIELAKKLNSTAITINNRLKKLSESGVINAFSTLIDYSKLDYQWFKADLYLKEYSKIHQIIKYIEKNPNLVGIDHTFGYVDLELEFILKNINHLNQIFEDLSIKFPDSIRNYSYFRLVDVKKFLVLDIE
jgi:Lrp/AsnC family leucine-responsive transcriptional regulator